MGALVRSFDWSTTPVGRMETWPQSLRTALDIMLTSRFPMFLWWGPERIQFYNDGYRPSLGANKHPSALGQRGEEGWAEIWHVIGPMIDAVFTRGESFWHEDQLIPIDRNGYLEEVFWTYSYSPIRLEDGTVGGTLVVVSETTQRVQAERRLATLRELAVTTASAKNERNACRLAAAALAQNSSDVPFSLLYLIDPDGKRARLAASAGLEAGTAAAPAQVDLGIMGHGERAEAGEAGEHEGQSEGGWPVARVARSGKQERVDDLVARFGPLAAGPWPESPSAALVLPFGQGGQAGGPASAGTAKEGDTAPRGVLVAGLSPRVPCSDAYRHFFELVAGQLTTAIHSARALELERERAEALVGHLSCACRKSLGAGTAAAGDGAVGDGAGAALRMAPLAGAPASLLAFATPHEGSRLHIPAPNGGGQPGQHLRHALRELPVERAPGDDALNGLGHVQPRAPQRGIEKENASLPAPLHERGGLMTSQVVPDQDQADRWQRGVFGGGVVAPVPVRPAPARRQRVDGNHRWERGQDRRQLVFEPRVQHGIRGVLDRLGAQFAGRWPEQGQQFRGAATDVFVRVPRRLPFGLPGAPRLRKGLIRASLILTPDRDAHSLGRQVRPLDGAFFSAVSGSVTMTTPAFRLRSTVPVWHQVRLFCHVYPASCSTCPMVQVLTLGSPSGARRSARCNVDSDQVAVPSCSRSGGRRNSRTIRSTAVGPYARGGPPPCPGSIAWIPSRLKRATSRPTPTCERRPACCAATVNDAPSATANSAFARATRSARSLPARASASSTSRSSAVTARNGSRCGRPLGCPIHYLIAPASLPRAAATVAVPFPFCHGHDK